jgi:antitoxin CcdA
MVVLSPHTAESDQAMTLTRTCLSAINMRIYNAHIDVRKGGHMYPYNTEAPKKATNLSINSDLLSQAKALNINLSAALEQALVHTLRQRRQEQWLLENREAINAYNDHVEAHGVFGDGLRSF